MPEERDEGWLMIAAVSAGFGTLLGFGSVLWQFFLRRAGGWHPAGLSKLLGGGGAVIAIVGLGVLALILGARLIRTHQKRGIVIVVVGAVLALSLGIVCLSDETVLAETALLLDPGAGALRPWEESLGHQPNAWLRYQLLRGCGAALVVFGVGLLGSNVSGRGRSHEDAK